MKLEKNYLITLPLTPAEFTTKKPVIVSKNGAIISVSCGGGMGGSFWKEYIIDFKPEMFFSSTCNHLVTVTLYDGSKKMINTNNIVDITPCTILRASVKHKNHNFTDNYREMYFTSNGNPVSFVNEYDSNAKCSVNEVIISPFHTECYKV